MALSIKTKEADRLARELSRRTGESLTEAVTLSLRERLDRTPEPEPLGPSKGEPGWIEHIRALVAELRGPGPFTPYTKEEADEICDEGIDAMVNRRS